MADNKNKILTPAQQQQEDIKALVASGPAQRKGAGGYVKDAALSLLADGVVGVGEAAVGLANIPTLGRAGKFLEDKAGYDPKATHEFIGGFKTEKSKEQLQDFADTEGFGGKLNYAKNNPSLIVNTVAESLPSMFAGGAVGRGLGMIAPKVSGVVAGALGEGVVGAGLAAESIRQQTDDGLLTGKQAGLAAATGATTAGFGFAGGKIAQKLGIGDIDTIIAGGGRTANPAASVAGSAAANASKNKGILRRGAEGALSEGLLEELPQSVSETILQNEALGRPLDEGVSDAAALGLLSGAAMGAGAGAFARNRRPDERLTPTEDMGQEDAGYGPTNPLNPSFSPAGLIGNESAPQLGFQGRATNQFNAGPDGEVFTGDQYNEYLAQQQERARTERDANQSQPRNFDDVTQTPQGYDQLGNDPRLPAPNDFVVDPDGTARTGADVNTTLQNEQQAQIEDRARRSRGEIVDRTPVPEAPKPSELMGLDANKGSLSAAAVLAVDSGASDIGNQMRDVSAQEPQMTAWQSGMTDRLANADPNSEVYGRLSQAIANEPVSAPEKARLMREASEIPKLDADIKQINPNTRVLDEARAQTRAYTPEGNEVQAQWDVVDASDLITSNTDSFTANPDFPASRQPRDRTRASAQQQVNEIASKLQPNILGESPDVSTGAPFVGATDNVVDSGNGRSMAIRKVYQENGAKAQEYRQFVNEQASKFGLDTDAVNMMQAPVLVRRNTSDMDRDEFARAANKPTAARMSSTEQAASDAKNLPDASLLSFNTDGNMSLYQSQGYLKNFVAGLPSTEKSSMMDENGGLSREGKSRIEAAIVQDAYNNPRLVSAISEKLDNDTTNVLRAITDKAPQISQLNSDAKSGVAFNNTLARDIADATQAYMDIKNSDKEVSDYLSQDSLLDDGLTDGAKEILSVMSDNRRSAKAIGENIQQRINAVTGRGNPKQGGLSFDDDMEADAPNVLNNEPATQLTDENPTVNIPAPKKAPRELSDRAMVHEMQKPTANNGEVDYKSKLNLSEGQNLGRLIMSSGRVFDDAVVKSMDDKGVTVEATVNGKRGLHKGMQYQTVDAGINNTKSYTEQQAARQEVNNNDNSSPNASEANETADNAGASRAKTGVSDRNAPKNAVARQKQTRAGLDAPSVDQEVSPPKTYAQVQTEVANEMGITTNEDGEYDISDAQFDTMEGRVRERMEVQESQAQPQSNVSETETKKTTTKTAPKPDDKPIPTGDWQTQVNGNNFRFNEDGITISKDDRVVHIRGANSITASKKAKSLVDEEIRDLHYIAAKEDANDSLSEGSIWLDGNGNMIRKKGTKKPKGALASVLKQTIAVPKQKAKASTTKNSEPKFSRVNTKGATNTTRQQVISKLSDKFGKETIAKLMADGKLDIKVLSDFVRNGRLTIPNDVDGLYLNGKATLIADNLSDGMIIPTFLHELGGHGGMQTLMDKKAYNALMKDFDLLVKAGDPLAVQAKSIADKVARSKQEALDEYLPYLLTLASRKQVRQGKIAGMINRMVMAIRSWLRNTLGASIKVNSQDILSLAERMVNEVEKQNSVFDAMDAVPQFSDPKNPDIRFSRAAGMNDQFDPRNIARESMTRFYDWASSNPPGKLSWWHKTLGTMYNLAQRNPYFKPVFDNTEKFINDVSYYASKASEFAPRLLPQLDSLRDITKSAIGAKDNEALSKPIFEGTLLWGRDLDGKAVLVEDWRKKTMSASLQDRLEMLKDAGRITPAQEADLAKLNAIQANRFVNSIIDEEVNAGLVWTDKELSDKFNLDDKQIELYREFRSATDKSLDSLTRSDMLRKMGKDANDIESQVMEVDTLREAVFVIEQHINDLIQASPKKEKALKGMLKDIKESQFRTNKLKDDGYAPLSRFGQYTVDVVDSDGNREYFGMFESAYDARKMEEDMKALYDDPATHIVSRGALSKEEFKLFAGVTPETAELFGEMLGLDATGDKAADEAFQEYLKRTKNNRSAMKRLMHRKGIKGYSEDVGRVLASFIYSNARHTSAALNMGNLDRSIADIPKGEGQLKDAAVKLAQYIKNPQEEGQVIRGWMFAQYLGGSVASAVVNLTQPIAVSFPYLSQFGGAVKAAAQLSKSSSDWGKSLKNKNNDHFEMDLREAIERAEADGTLSPQEVHNLMKMASGKNPLRAGDGTKIGNAKALAGNSLSRVSLAWGSLFSLAEQVNRRVTFVAAYRMAKEQGMDNPAEFATNSIKETQFVYNKASRMNWGRGAVGGTLMTFKTYTVSYMELMHRLWTQGEKGSVERDQGRKAVGIMVGTLLLLGGAGGLPFMEDAEDLVDGIGQIMGYNFSSKKVRQQFLDEWVGEMAGDFIDGGISSVSGSPTDVSGRLGLGNLIPGTGIFKERTSNSRDVLEIVGPAGDFVGRVATGTRDIAKGVANLDSTSLKKGALEFAPTAVRNAVKGTSMATSGIYKDTKGYKVADVTPVDAAFKFFGFQPRDISKIQEANYLGQSSTSYYNLRASSIRALWAAGVVEGNQSKVDDARDAVKDWNKKNPNQKIIIKPNDIARRVREMKMDKVDRVIKLAPKSGRGTLAQELNGVRDGM